MDVQQQQPLQAQEQAEQQTVATAAQEAEQQLHQEQQAQQQRYAAPDDVDDVSGLTPEQVVRAYCCRPPMLFTALHKVSGRGKCVYFVCLHRCNFQIYQWKFFFLVKWEFF